MSCYGQGPYVMLICIRSKAILFLPHDPWTDAGPLRPASEATSLNCHSTGPLPKRYPVPVHDGVPGARASSVIPGAGRNCEKFVGTTVVKHESRMVNVKPH